MQRGKGEVPVSLPPLWENFETYAKQSWSYEVFAIHHDLMYEHFDS